MVDLDEMVRRNNPSVHPNTAPVASTNEVDQLRQELEQLKKANQLREQREQEATKAAIERQKNTGEQVVGGVIILTFFLLIIMAALANMPMLILGAIVVLPIVGVLFMVLNRLFRKN